MTVRFRPVEADEPVDEQRAAQPLPGEPALREGRGGFGRPRRVRDDARGVPPRPRARVGDRHGRAAARRDQLPGQEGILGHVAGNNLAFETNDKTHILSIPELK